MSIESDRGRPVIVVNGPGQIWIADLDQPSTPVPMRRRDRRKQQRAMKRWKQLGVTEEPGEP